MQREMNSPRTPNRLVGRELEARLDLYFVDDVGRTRPFGVDVAKVRQVNTAVLSDDLLKEVHHPERIT